tara:strand:- start:304 stop:765 length:462 start_codon:yes stop_codon:yes gene_type:complete
MKVSGPKGPNKTQNTKKSGKKGDSSGLSGFSALISTAAGDAEAATASKSIASVNSLLSVQETDDPAKRAAKQRMAKRGHDILDALEQIKMALINGNLRYSHLENIGDMVARNRERIDDPEMAALLDEIDLRAQVEIAKLEVAKEAALRQMNMG